MVVCGVPGEAADIGQESGGWEPDGQHADRKQESAKDSLQPAGHKRHCGGSNCL